jgi:signal transduction histidine kinase
VTFSPLVDAAAKGLHDESSLIAAPSQQLVLMHSTAAPYRTVHDELHPPGGIDHRVQFYEDEDYLASAVADFLAGGLTIGQPGIVIATDAHRAAFAEHLESEGFDVEAEVRAGHLAMLDARTTLDQIMRGASPDPARFRTVIGGAIEGHFDADGADRPVVRLYGEMVDLLWRDGNTDASLRVEELWNALGDTYAFSLLCAYPMANFYKTTDAQRFQEICRLHTHVIPTERFVAATEEQRLVEVTVLQQRARTLEAEIAQRRELERRLRERERELRELVSEREQLLTAERLARAEAEAASQAKSDFLAMMSPELRTPLNAIAGHIQLIEMGLHGPISDAQREALARVERSQRHLLSLINDVLNLARIESGRVDYTIEDFALALLVADTVSMLEPLIVAGKLECEVSSRPTAAGVPVVARADREKTHQIVMNLLTNAIKFTPAGGCITVDLAAHQSDPATVCVRVADTGIGIAPTQLERIFEPFVQVGRSATVRREGVGLGLAISRDLARGMGGDLTVESTLGAGTTFTLRLPAA